MREKKIYNKLIRDNMVEIIKSNNATPKVRILNDNEYEKELCKKLEEEVKEFLESKDILELCDIQEVLLNLVKFKKVSRKKFDQLLKDKAKKRGSFKKKIYLEYTIEN